MDKIVIGLVVVTAIIVGMCFGYILACTTFDAEAYAPEPVITFDTIVNDADKFILYMNEDGTDVNTIEFDPNYYDYNVDTQVAKVIIKFIPKVGPMEYEEDYDSEANRCL